MFLESYIEEKVWDALKSEDIDAERQYEIYYNEKKKASSQEFVGKFRHWKVSQLMK